MKMVLKYLAGSISYGLSTPQSDLDYRGVYLSEDPAELYGFKESPVIASDPAHPGTDVVYYELRHFLRLLRKTNTQAIEILFNKNWLTSTDLGDDLIAARRFLIDMPVLHKSLTGYAKNEWDVAVGISSKDLGDKRKKEVTAYGYSPKNMAQALRLLRCGKVFFETGEFPVNIREHDNSFGSLLFLIKTTPEVYTVEELGRIYETATREFHKAYEESELIYTYKFDVTTATNICRYAYKNV
jgi:uncharacterized protein